MGKKPSHSHKHVERFASQAVAVQRSIVADHRDNRDDPVGWWKQIRLLHGAARELAASSRIKSPPLVPYTKLVLADEDARDAIDRHFSLCTKAIDDLLAWASQEGNARIAPTVTLTGTQRRALELIRTEGPLIGKELAKRLNIAQDTLRRHIIPKLRLFGVQNDRSGKGYFCN